MALAPPDRQGPTGSPTALPLRAAPRYSARVTTPSLPEIVQPQRRIERFQPVWAPVVDEGGLEPAAASVDALDDGAADIAVADHPDARGGHVTASLTSVLKPRQTPPDIAASTASTASQMSTWRM